MATNSFSGPAVPAKLCRKLSNGAGNRTLNLMPSMTTFRKSSNSMDTTAARYPATTILMTGCCCRKMRRHRTCDGCYAFFIICAILITFPITAISHFSYFILVYSIHSKQLLLALPTVPYWEYKIHNEKQKCYLTIHQGHIQQLRCPYPYTK